VVEQQVAPLKRMPPPLAAGAFASMGPRVFTRGNQRRTFHGKHDERPLQWGHASSRVETEVLSRLQSGKGASMGPRVFTRGNPNTGELAVNNADASMGPRVFTRGNKERDRSTRGESRRFNGATRLHAWKPGLAVARASGFARLQWGHASSRVETSLKPS